MKDWTEWVNSVIPQAEPQFLLIEEENNWDWPGLHSGPLMVQGPQ